jgi:tagatose-1,6-bisphosphate aldolase
MKLTITIVVYYDETSVNEHTKTCVRREVERCVQEGLLSPTGEEVVDEYIMDVEEEQQHV